MNRREKDYNTILESVERMRKIQEVGVESIILESDEKDGEESKKSVPYTNQDEMLRNSIQPCRMQFGGNFARLKTPMLYYPEDGDVTLSGVIPSLNDAKFQFRLLEPSGNGCFLWLDSIQLSDETINKINKIYGVYKNWKQQLSTSEDIKPMSVKNEQ